MQYKQLGNTNLIVSRLGMGIGGIMGEKFFSEKKALQLIQTAIDNGINFFDTGNSYSHGNAEIRLGKVIRRNDRDKLIIATKGGTVLTKAHKFIKDFSAESLTRQLHDSLRKLKTDHIDLYQLHDPHPHHLTEELFKLLESFKQSGKVRYIGISTGGKLLDRVIPMDVFNTVMVSYNILHRSPEPQLAEAKKHGKGVIIKSPLAQTMFTNDIFKIKNIADIWYFLRFLKNHRKKYKKGRKCRFLNEMEGWTGPELALKFVLENPHVDMAITGTTRVEHLISNIHAIEKEWEQKTYSLIKSKCNL